ncbi:MAG TPA: 50S ribosomal protein L19 [Candidatus Omnitrophica bacterium]|nr:50S ribosomal protein L19 [Candidatus Omnitrophota bacterium]
MHKKIAELEKKQLRDDLPELNIGDHVKVYVKIREGDKIRSHPFEGTLIAKKGSGPRTAFTVRRISFREGAEKVFLMNSPAIEKIDVMKSTKVKRAKIYYLRKRKGKKAIL